MEKKQKPFLVRMALSVLVGALTLVVLIEEWIWFRLLSVMQRIAKLPIFKQIEGWMREQNRWVSLGLFIIPELSFIPVKLSVIWLFGNHHPYLGVLTFVSAKIAGTALFAWLYSVTEAKITQFGFICSIRDKVFFVRKWVHDWLHSQPLYHLVRNKVEEIRVRLKTQREHWMKRRYRAARVIVRREHRKVDKQA